MIFLQMRVLFYMALSGGLHDEESQKRGIVSVYYGIGQTKFFALHRPFEYIKLNKAAPVRVVALHACSDNPAIKASEEVLCRAMDGKTLSRYRLHVGKSEDAFRYFYSLR
jgi:hypothetical protein